MEPGMTYSEAKLVHLIQAGLVLGRDLGKEVVHRVKVIYLRRQPSRRSLPRALHRAGHDCPGGVDGRTVRGPAHPAGGVNGQGDVPAVRHAILHVLVVLHQHLLVPELLRQPLRKELVLILKELDHLGHELPVSLVRHGLRGSLLKVGPSTQLCTHGERSKQMCVYSYSLQVACVEVL
jgi:hypothetical protein